MPEEVRDGNGTLKLTSDWSSEEGGGFTTSRVDVAALATGGAGTEASPWTGAIAAIQKQSNTTYCFAKGYYAGTDLIFEATEETPMTEITLEAEPGTVLVLSGSVAASGEGDCFPVGTALAFGSLTRPPPYPETPQSIHIRGRLIIDGGGTARYGLLLLHAWNALTENVSFQNFADGPNVTGVAVATGQNPAFTKVAHGFTKGSYIIVEGMSSGGGESHGVWIITEVPDADTFKVGDSLTTASSGTGGTVRLCSIGLLGEWSLNCTHINMSAAADLTGDQPPTVGMWNGRDIRTNDTTGFYSTVNTFIALRAEACHTGVVLDGCANYTFIGGTSEFNDAWGVKMINTPRGNTFIGFDVEANSGPDIGVATFAAGNNPAITLTAHGLILGQRVHFKSASGGASGAGNRAWTVSAISDANTFQVGTSLTTTDVGTATIATGGDIEALPNAFDSSNIFQNCIQLYNHFDSTASDIIIDGAQMRGVNNLNLASVRGGGIYLRPQHGSSAGALSLVATGSNNVAATMPHGSYYSFGSDANAGFLSSPGNGWWMAGASPFGSVSDDNGDFNLIAPSGKSWNYGINNVLFARLKSTGWHYYTPVITAPRTVAQLPAASSTIEGARLYVTDANATMAAGIGTTVVGGGSNKVPVYCDGSNWIIG